MPDESKPEQPKPAAPAKPPAASGAAAPGTAGEAKHAAPKPPVGPQPEPWDSDLVQSVKKAFGDVPIEALKHIGQTYFIVPRESSLAIANFLLSECGFNLLADLTAVDYPKREKRFEVIYQLYSFDRNERLRVKVPVAETETIESVVPVWTTADWLEREVFDMFGIRFEHHPNLRRILLPDEWEGYPLRKDYGILQQDVKWVRENLHIESGQ